MSDLIPRKETLEVEFKSDRNRLPDRDLVLAVVCLANTRGGVIYLGVEDEGTVTGLHPQHDSITGLAALIGNRTSPPVPVRCDILTVEGKRVARIEVPRLDRIVASNDGTIQRRRLLANGQPECVPMLPGEFVTRQSDLRRVDYSALPVAGATEGDLDSVERERLRRAVERFGGDHSLLGLDDRELDGALGLTRAEGGERRPTVLGLLLIGTEAALREHLPTHEVAFQVLEHEAVRVNAFYHLPLLRVFEQLESMMDARIIEREVQVGLFRVAVPNIDRRAWREAAVNAITHRDYTRLGAIHIRLQDDALTFSNPGGFVEGVTLDTILVVEPKPRNPSLADAFKRIGLAERTGRGVDLIYRGLLGYGRPAPSYARSTGDSVVLEMSCGEPDLDFVEWVAEQENQKGAPLPLDTLLVLQRLHRERRLDVAEVARELQKDVAAAHAVLERLVEAGIVTALGVKKGRTYTLSAREYRRHGDADGFIRQAGFEPIQQEEMVKRYVREHGDIRRRDVMTLCQVGPYQATRLLKKLVDLEALTKEGQGKGTRYVRGAKI